MKTGLCISSAFFALALVATVGVQPAQAENCLDLIVNNVYSCQVKSDFGTTFSDCFRFISPGAISLKFDLVVDGFGQLGCSCKATGTSKAPVFNDADSFLCTASLGNGGNTDRTVGRDPITHSTDFGLSFKGLADGKKVKYGQAVNEYGDAFVFECKQDPNCSSTPTAATQGTQGRYKRP